MKYYHYRLQRSCEGYVFTPVCYSVHRGGLPECMLGYHHPLGADTPLDQAPPGAGTPWSRHPPEQAPPAADTPQNRHPPRAGTPRQMATVADGTHPTGMHSCLLLCLNFSKIIFLK